MENIALNITAHVCLIFFLYWQYKGHCDKKNLRHQLFFVFIFLVGSELTAYRGMSNLQILAFQVFFIIGSGIMLLKEMNTAILITTFNGIAAALPGRIVGNIMILYASDIENPYRWIIAIMVSLAFHVLVLYFILKYIGEFFDSIRREKSFPWPVVAMIPTLYYIIVYMLMNFPMNFWDQPMNMAIAEVVSLLVVCTYILMIQTIKYQKNNSTLYYNNQEYEILISQMQSRIELNMDKQKQAAIARHDLRHVNNVVRQLVEEGQTEMALAVLDTHDAEMENLAMVHFCKNVVINSVLEFTKARCEALDVDFEVQADIPVEMPVPDLELAMVISNMLENALNATKVVKNDRFINFLSMKKGDKHIVQISNPYLGLIEYDDNNLPISENGAGHGLGMQSIAIFAAKYDALFDCEEKDGLFIARLLLQGEKEPEEDELELLD